MKRQNIVLIIMLSIGAVLFALGIIFMAACNFSIVGLTVMCIGLAVFIPLCPIYQKLGGYDIVFKDKLQTFLYIVGIILIIAVGVGVTLACYPLNIAVEGLQLGGFMLAGLALALLLMNAFIYDTIKKRD